jgi:hypothetical protein
MKAVSSSEMFVEFHWTTWNCNPDDGTPYSHHSEKLNFKIRDIYLHFIGSEKYIKNNNKD